MGRREREGQGTYHGPWLEQEGGGAGRSREQARWRSGFAAAALLRPVRGHAMVEAVVERRSGAGGPFKGELRRWSGRGGLVPPGEWRGEP